MWTLNTRSLDHISEVYREEFSRRYEMQVWSRNNTINISWRGKSENTKTWVGSKTKKTSNLNWKLYANHPTLLVLQGHTYLRHTDGHDIT